MITGDIKHLEDYKKQLPTFIYECLKKLRLLISPLNRMESTKSMAAIWAWSRL